jgi:hypothetical protein
MHLRQLSILCIPIICCILLLSFGTSHAADKPGAESYWPVAPIQESVGSKISSSLNASFHEKHYLTFHPTWVAVEMIVEPVILGTAPFYKPLMQTPKKYGKSQPTCP